MRTRLHGAVVAGLMTVALSGSPALAGPLSDFTVAVLPDTQLYTYGFANRNNPASPGQAFFTQFQSQLAAYISGNGIFQAQADWLASNAAALNLKLVTHVGDVTQGTIQRDEAPPAQRGALPEHNIPGQWNYAGNVYASLRNAGVPVAVTIGNHDDSEDGYNDTDFWNQTFGASSGFFAGDPGFLGFSPNDRNSARLIDLGMGKQILSLSLDYLEMPANLAERTAFAQAQIDAHPGVPTIVTTHKGIDELGNFQTSAQDLLDNVVTPNPEVFLVLSGHYTVVDFNTALFGPDGSAEQVAVTQNSTGEDVYHIVANYQSGTPLDAGYIRLMEFDIAGGEIDVSTYSPINDEFRLGDDMAFGQTTPFSFGTTADFSLPVDFGPNGLALVPLPAAGWLMLAGFAGLLLVGRRRPTRSR